MNELQIEQQVKTEIYNFSSPYVDNLRVKLYRNYRQECNRLISMDPSEANEAKELLRKYYKGNQKWINEQEEKQGKVLGLELKDRIDWLFDNTHKDLEQILNGPKLSEIVSFMKKGTKLKISAIDEDGILKFDFLNSSGKHVNSTLLDFYSLKLHQLAELRAKRAINERLKEKIFSKESSADFNYKLDEDELSIGDTTPTECSKKFNKKGAAKHLKYYIDDWNKFIKICEHYTKPFDFNYKYRGKEKFNHNVSLITKTGDEKYQWNGLGHGVAGEMNYFLSALSNANSLLKTNVDQEELGGAVKSFFNVNQEDVRALVRNINTPNKNTDYSSCFEFIAAL